MHAQAICMKDYCGRGNVSKANENNFRPQQRLVACQEGSTFVASEPQQPQLAPASLQVCIDSPSSPVSPQTSAKPVFRYLSCNTFIHSCAPSVMTIIHMQMQACGQVQSFQVRSMIGIFRVLRDTCAKKSTMLLLFQMKGSWSEPLTQFSYQNVSKLCQADFKFSCHYRLRSLLFCS